MSTYDGPMRKGEVPILPIGKPEDKPQIVLKTVPLGSRRPHAIYFDDPSLTVQASKDETDINLIVARAVRGADITHVNTRVAKYGDFSNVPSYQEALDLVTRAEGMFMELPADVRSRFENEPAKMVAFLQDEKNTDEAIKLGLAVAKEVPAPLPPVIPAKPGE